MNSISGNDVTLEKKNWWKELMQNLPRGFEPLHVSGDSIKLIHIMAMGVGG